MITSTGASRRIEGSRLADKDVEKLLKRVRVGKLKDRDSQEVTGYAEVLQTVFDAYPDIPFSEGLILRFHRQLLKYSDKDKGQGGKYKSSPNRVVANFIVEFLAIHPLHDGNGRLSRILTHLLLAQSGYAYMPYASLEKSPKTIIRKIRGNLNPESR